MLVRSLINTPTTPALSYAASAPFKNEPEKAAPPLDRLAPNYSPEAGELNSTGPKSILTPQQTRPAEDFNFSRLLGYMFFPESLYQRQALVDGAGKMLSGKDYGHRLNPSTGVTTPAVQRSAEFMKGLVDKVAGDRFKAAGLDVEVNLYASDKVDSFARPITKKMGLWGYVKSFFGGEPEPPTRYEIGFTAGALNAAETEDELAFLAAREAGKVLDQKAGSGIEALLNSQSRATQADHRGLELMTQAGFDPSEGIDCLHKLSTPESSKNPLAEALGAGFSSTQDSGVRSALSQLQLEQLRRTQSAALPREQHQAVPEEVRLNLPDYQGEHPLRGHCRQLAADYIKGDIQVEWDATPAPAGSVVRESLLTSPWDTAAVAEGYSEALDTLGGSNLSAQQKGDRALYMLHALHAAGWDRQGPPSLGQEGANKLNGFLQQQIQDGWTSSAFLGGLKEMGEASRSESRAEPDFAHKVMLTPDFQQAVADLPEFGKLYEAMPQMLLVRRDNEEGVEVEQVAAAAAILAGQTKPEAYEFWRGWPEELPAGQGPMDGGNRTRISGLFEDLGKTDKLAQNVHLKSLRDKLADAANGNFAAQVQQAVTPAMERLGDSREGLFATAATDPSKARQLFDTLELCPLPGAPSTQETTLLKQMLKQGEGRLQAFSPKPFTQIPAWGRLLGQALDSAQFANDEKQAIADFMLSQTPSDGFAADGVEAERPGLGALARYLESKTDLELLQGIEKEIAANGIGTPLPRGATNPKHSTPLLSFVGKHRDLSKRVAASSNPFQLDGWLAKQHHSRQHRIDIGSRLFLTDCLLAQQTPKTPLDDWCRRVNALEDPFLFNLYPEVKDELGKHLATVLRPLEAGELRTALHQEPVGRILAGDKHAELLVKLLNPADKEVDTLTNELRQLEKEFGLTDSVMLRKQVYELVAEQAQLQPRDVDKVLLPMPEQPEMVGAVVEAGIRGLSAMAAAVRARPAQEQLATLEYLMGHSDQLPAFVAKMDRDLMGLTDSYDLRIADELRASGASLTTVFASARAFLAEADMIVRTTVAGGLLSGPDGLLHREGGREAILNQYLGLIPDDYQGLAKDLAIAAVDAQGQVDGITVGYLLSQKPPVAEEGAEAAAPEMSPGQAAHHIFGSFGVPGKKFEQYLAISEVGRPYRKDFEESQDSAEDINYLQAVRLVQHHYGDTWPEHRRIDKAIGCGSVNAAIMFTDTRTGERGVVGLPLKDIQNKAEYDFIRIKNLVKNLNKNPENRKYYGWMEGLLDIIKPSVFLEFDRPRVFDMHKSVEPYYQKEVDDWKVKVVKARSLEGINNQAIVMDLATGKTARRVLNESPEVYDEAMTAAYECIKDVLVGVTPDGNVRPRPLDANPDMHNGQVLIDSETREVQILDFGQAVPITNDERDYAMEISTILAGVRSPEKSAALLSARSGLKIPAEDMKEILEFEDPMSIFIQILGYLGNHGAEVPISTVHWVLAANRQRELAGELGENFNASAMGMGASFLLTDSLTGYNAVRKVRETATEVFEDIVGRVSSLFSSHDESVAVEPPH